MGELYNTRLLSKVHVFSDSFVSAVDEGTKNIKSIYALSAGSMVYLFLEENQLSEDSENLRQKIVLAHVLHANPVP